MTSDAIVGDDGPLTCATVSNGEPADASVKLSPESTSSVMGESALMVAVVVPAEARYSFISFLSLEFVRRVHGRDRFRGRVLRGVVLARTRPRRGTRARPGPLLERRGAACR